MTVTPVGAGHYSDKGPHRVRNEDVAFHSVDDGVYIVADGLGGAAAGDRASKIATEIMSSALTDQTSGKVAVQQLLPDGLTRAVLQSLAPQSSDLSDPEARLRFAFLVAHCGVLAEGRSSGCVGMATAMIVAWLTGDGAWIGHVGDCRAYALVGRVLEKLTEDHSLSQALAGRKTLPKGAEDSPFLRSRLTQVVGGENEPSPDLCRWYPSPGSRLLLCSDGVWGSLTDGELRAVISGESTPEQMSQQLVEKAIDAGSRDNVTALVVHF